MILSNNKHNYEVDLYFDRVFPYGKMLGPKSACANWVDSIFTAHESTEFSVDIDYQASDELLFYINELFY